ncbi:MAG TPA: methyltransferase domain-containing protein, partial [Bacteroidia bacterium]|nr:methyltransferase domain-containing protein [Bacteroidia bacterium]
MSIEANKRLDFFEKSSKKHPRKGWLNGYYWRDITFFCNYFSHEEISVLEIGCGTGELIGKVKGRRKVGIDFSPSMIEIGKKQYPDVEFICMNAEEIELNEKFDLIILSNLVGHLDDVEKVFLELNKLCHPGTKIIVNYYNYLWEPLLKLAEAVGLKSAPYRQNWLTLRDINNLLYISGFDVYRNVRRMLFPVYIPLLSEFFNGFLAKMPFFRYFCINQFAFAKPIPEITTEDANAKYSVSVVIPARNESGNIENAITRLPKFGKHVEIIFIEGNSTDDTWDKIQEIQKKYSATHDIKI